MPYDHPERSAQMDNDLSCGLLAHPGQMNPDDKPDRPSAEFPRFGSLVVALASVVGFLLRVLFRYFP